jgi:hypothetical protein
MTRKRLELVGFILLMFAAFIPLGLAAPPVKAAQATPADGESERSHVISCTPERPTVWPRETIHANVWVPQSTPPPNYAWSATAGRLVGQASEVTWDFAGVQPGAYTATVEVSSVNKPSITCSIEVIVLEREAGRGIPRLSGRSLLPGNSAEAEGYGLYSYLLFANPPEGSSIERYTKAIEAYLSLMPNMEALEKYSKRSVLNITYAPVDTDSPKSISPDWVLSHYNYARALVLLRAVPGSHRDGPYIVSSLTPLTGTESLGGDYLFQDLSSVPPHLVSTWVKLFLNQASQERFWEERSGPYFALRLRTAVGILAIGLPDVQSSLNSWLSWGHANSGR